MKLVFIDGYNVINSWPNLKQLKEITFQGAREKLIETLHNYSSFMKYKVYLVFDGYLKSGNLESKEIKDNIVIIYTKEGETADSYIEKKVDSLGRKKDILVVTSDSLEQQLIFQRGAVRMSSMELYYEVLKMEEDIKQKHKKNNSNKKNLLSDRLEKETMEKLEKIRRSR
ncbi:MAG: NYN domain-containing protein [Clostridiaceae bacterium]